MRGLKGGLIGTVTYARMIDLNLLVLSAFPVMFRIGICTKRLALHKHRSVKLLLNFELPMPRDKEQRQMKEGEHKVRYYAEEF